MNPGGTQGTATGVMEAVKEKVQNVTDGASDLVDKAKETTQEWASAAAGMAEQAGERARQAASFAADTAEDLGQEATRLIRRYPIPAVLIGFGVGFLMAQAFCSRND